MPIYEYVCSSCSNRTEFLHGVHDEGPAFCPVCGVEGSMRKAFAPPAILFKGSGWAKKERRTATSGGAKKDAGDGGDAPEKGGTAPSPSGDAAATSASSSSADAPSKPRDG